MNLKSRTKAYIICTRHGKLSRKGWESYNYRLFHHVNANMHTSRLYRTGILEYLLEWKLSSRIVLNMFLRFMPAVSIPVFNTAQYIRAMYKQAHLDVDVDADEPRIRMCM